MSEHKEPIPSMIYNASVGGHVTSSQQIIDENENKEQSQINAEVKQNLGQGGSVDTRINQAKSDIIEGASSNGNTLKKLEDRVSPIESAIGTGGNIDTRIDAAKLEIKGNVTSACDTLGKAEVKINYNTVAISEESARAQTAEEQLRTLYNNLQQSQPIPVTELPNSGEEGKIYRLAGTTNYSDYMWNGTQFVKMATYNNAIDNEPIIESENLVKSGGVYKKINKSSFFLSEQGTDGQIVANLYNFKCEYGKTYRFYHRTSGTKFTHHLHLQNINNQAQSSILQDITFIASNDYIVTEFTCNVAEGTKYIRLHAISDGAEVSVIDAFIVEKDSIIDKVELNEKKIYKAEEKIDNIKSNEEEIKSFIGFNLYNFTLPISSEVPPETNVAELYDFYCEQGKTYVIYHKTKGTDWTHYIYLQNINNQAQSSVLQTITFRKSEDYTTTEFTCNVEGGTKYIRLRVWTTGIEGQVDFFIVEKDSLIDKVEEFRNSGVDLSKIEAEVDDVRKGLYGSSIFDVNKKQYFKNLFIQANWASRNGGNTPHISPLVMLWFSDIHGSKYNYNRLIEFKNYFNEYIQASICTGDIVQSYYSNDFSYFTANDIMLVIGNHDVQDSTTNEHSHIGLDAYNKYFTPFISNWGVIQPENAATEGLCYYYKDFTDRGIRLIVLDKMAWNSAQNTWLQGVLTDAKNNNLAVICANHYPASNTNFNRDCSFCSLYTDKIGGMPIDVINSIQSFIDDEHGEFICHISGHTHADYYGIIDGTSQISITIDCAYCNYDAWNDSDRVEGEKSADCFNILSIDTYDKTLKIFRVGVDRDRWLRHKGTMCLKYDTKNLLWND